MPKLKSFIPLLLITASLGVCSRANAQWAVVDVGAITQLVQEVTTLQQQLSTAQQNLAQAQQQYQSMTGGRGMQNLLSGTVRNYLPSDLSALQGALTQASGAYQALSSSVQRTMTANALLTPQQFQNLAPAEQSHLTAARQSAAMLQSVSGAALSNTSARFASIQQLITAIPTATDQKAILDLQARIQAEQGMLANEQTKLQVLYQANQAQEMVRKQRVREQAMADIGKFASLPPLGH